MTDEQSKTQSKSSKTLKLIIIAAIIAVAVIAVLIINSTEPTATREAATKKTAILVDVETVQRGTYFPQIHGLGTVEAARDITLNARVAGRIVEMSEDFIPGGFVQNDEVLARIDPADYENTVQQMRSMVAQAQSELDVERGRRDVAQKEYDLLGQDLATENKALVLREPQLAAAQAELDSAMAGLNQAELDLDRTNITAPFDAQILSRSVNLGSEVDANTPIARLVGVDEYWVIVTVPVSMIDRIEFPSGNEVGADVTIRNRAAWGDDQIRMGQVVRLIGALDEQTRLARIVVRVQDPLALGMAADTPRLLVGSIVQAEIKGRQLDNVFRINRDYLREGDRLWLNRDGKLTITDADVLLKDKDYAYIADGMNDGDMLVTNNLTTVAEGTELRTETEPADDNGQEATP